MSARARGRVNLGSPNARTNVQSDGEVSIRDSWMIDDGEGVGITWE